MNKPKTILSKSKSFNTAITKKPEIRSDKKSRSHGEFKPPAKKRGVYVEKKSTKLFFNDPVPEKPKRIPRPGKKRFLTSVLTILSKSTAGTQFPDTNYTKTKTKQTKNYDEDYVVKDLGTTKKKIKYKSRVLNDNKNCEDQFVVLQSKRDINNTPSNYSETSREPDTVKWSDFLPPLVPRNDSDVTVINTGKLTETAKQKKVTLVENKEPTTLLSSEDKKHDNNFYNFFVDLLETTFDVYNVKTELHRTASVNSSKVVFEINESVAKKLKIEKPITGKWENSDHSINNYCCGRRDFKINDYNVNSVKPKSFHYYVQESPKTTKNVKRKLKSGSFEYKKKSPIPVTHSFIYEKSTTAYKKPLKSDRKKNFLNILKEELKMDDVIYEEPRNFYQALKVMARTKRRYQKSISFHESTKKYEDDDKECVFKRRRLLSSKSKKKLNHSLYSKSLTASHNTSTPNPKNITSNSDSGSSHSIQVYGFEYESAHPNIIRNWEKVESGNSYTSFKSNLNNELSLYFSNSTIFDDNVSNSNSFSEISET